MIDAPWENVDNWIRFNVFSSTWPCKNIVFVCSFDLEWVSVVKRSKTCRPSDEQTLICQFWDVPEEEKSTSWIHTYDICQMLRG